MPQNIDYIIFDLGGVIYNVDYHATILELSEIGGRDFEEFFSQKSQGQLVDKFEEGKISEESFFLSLQELCTTPCAIPELKAAWNKMLLGFRPEAVSFLKRLNKQLPIYLFSNNNVTHYQAIEQEVGKAHLSAFNQLFVNTYYSHTFGHRKPKEQAFLNLLDQERLVATRGLFIDDSPQHLVGAEKAGLQVKKLDRGERIENVLSNILR